MPIPRPITDESRSDFLARCMNDTNMQEYDNQQRYAICLGQWENRKEIIHLGKLLDEAKS